MERHVRVGALVAGTLLLAACGGGGGGGGGDDSAEAVQSSKLTMDSNNYATKAVPISTETEVDGVVQLYADRDEGLGLVSGLRDETIIQNNGQSGAITCSGGGTASVIYEDTASKYEEQWTFEDCIVAVAYHGSASFNGSYSYVQRMTGQTESSESWEWFENFDVSGELLYSSEPFAINGRMHWHLHVDIGAASERLVETIESMEFSMGDRYVAIADQENIIEADQYSATFQSSGQIVGSAISGYIAVSTPVALAISTYDECPSEGIVRISSDGAAEFRYGSSANGTAGAMAIWVNDQLLASYNSCSSIPFAPIY